MEDSEGQRLYHNELWTLTRKMVAEGEHRIAFTIPIFEPLPSQYYIRCWLFAGTLHAAFFLGLLRSASRA